MHGNHLHVQIDECCRLVVGKSLVERGGFAGMSDSVGDD